MSYRKDMPEGDETSKVHDRIAPYVTGHGVDLGCGGWPLKVQKSKDNSCLGVDGGESQFACSHADVIADVSNLSMFSDESFDYVYSSHTLEDLPYTEAVLMEWWRLVKVGGNLILYLPLTRKVAKELGLENWQDFYPNMGEEGANVWHRHDFHPQAIRDIIEKIGLGESLADEIRGDKDEYSFLLVYRKLASANSELRGNNMIECLCEYHRRHLHETDEEVVRSDGKAESGISFVGEKESMVQGRAAMVQESWPTAS